MTGEIDRDRNGWIDRLYAGAELSQIVVSVLVKKSNKITAMKLYILICFRDIIAEHLAEFTAAVLAVAEGSAEDVHKECIRVIIPNNFFHMGQAVFTITGLIAAQTPFCIEVITDKWCAIGLAYAPFRKTTCSSFIIFDAVISNKFEIFACNRITDSADPVALDSWVLHGTWHFRIKIGHSPMILAVYHHRINLSCIEEFFIFSDVQMVKCYSRWSRRMMIDQVTASAVAV